MGVDQIRTERKTRRISFRIPESVKTNEEVLPICPARQYYTERRQYQEDDGDIETKGHSCIREKHNQASIQNILKTQSRPLKNKTTKAIHSRTNRRKIVQRHKRIHLVL